MVDVAFGAVAACAAVTGHAAGLEDMSHSTGGIYVAVRDDGAVSRSNTNGVTYNVVSTGSAKPLHGVAFAGTWFVAVGDSGRAIRSSDTGLHWAADNSRTTSRLREVTAHANGDYFIAVGDTGTTLRKVTSAAAWDTTASPTAKALYSVASNGLNPGILVAVGNAGTILRSTDQGITWSVLAALPRRSQPARRRRWLVQQLLRSRGPGREDFPQHRYRILLGRGVESGRDRRFERRRERPLQPLRRRRRGRYGGTERHECGARQLAAGSPGSAVTLAGVHHDGVYFYAVGGSEGVFRSLDGTSWLNVPVAPATWSDVKRRYGDGR